jgi:hypothetical protein
MVGLLLLPFLVYGQSEQTTSNSPPVAQNLVREGDFAVRLVEMLKIGSAQNEAEAEAMLTAIDIVPENGWIADYPVTPVVIGELQQAVSQAADSNRLPMKRDEALQALENLTAELGLSVVSDTSSQQAAVEPPETYPDYVNPTVVNNYYYNEGPPVVTYYPPPPDYGYLYSWYPYPFWHSGFFFRGFFVLHDFHKVIIVNKKRVVVSNHVFDHKHRRYHTIDPVKRYRRDHGGIHRNDREVFRERDRRSFERRRGTESILKRSLEQRRSDRGPGGRSFDTVKPRTRPEERSPRVREPRTVNRRVDNLRRDSTIERRRDSMIERQRGMDRSERSFRSERNRNFNSGPSIREERGRRSPRAEGPSIRRETRRSESFRGRSFNAPSRNFERSFGSNHRGRGNGCRGHC